MATLTSSLLAAFLSAFLTATAYVLAGLLRGTHPYGRESRSTLDLGQQFVPMYAHYRDLLTGESQGDWFLSWGPGFGVPFLGDFMSYLGSAFAWVVVLFPRDRVDLALYVITVLALASAAAAMTTYLRRLRPSGPPWLASVLGMSYALCGWSVETGTYMTVWLNGLVAFPLLLLLVDLLLTRRSVVWFVAAPLVVALLWTSHFYTVYMATVGAALVTAARLLTLGKELSWASRLRHGATAAVAVLLGIGLSAPVLVPTYRGVQLSRESPDILFEPASWPEVAGRLLPGTAGLSVSPGLAAGTLALLLALSLPLNGRVAVRDRLIWSLLPALTLASMQFEPTMSAWHAFDNPNGNFYRQAFVLVGMMVIAGWVSAAAGLRGWLPVAAPMGALAVLYVVAEATTVMTSTTRVVVPAFATLLLVLSLVLRRGNGPTAHRGAASLAVLVAVWGEAAVAAAAVDEARAAQLGSPRPVWGPVHERARELVLANDRWPESRTSPGSHLTVNDPMLIGGQGPEFYSSTIPAALSETLIDLGFGYAAFGRAPTDPQNPVVDTVFGIEARVVGPTGRAVGTAEDLSVARREASPLMTVRDRAWVSTDPSPFGPQETALGADVYQVPALGMDPSEGLDVSPSRTGKIRLVPAGGSTEPVELLLSARCRPGSEVYLHAPELVATVLGPDGWTSVLGPDARRPGVFTTAPLQHVGTTEDDGSVAVRLALTKETRLPAQPLGCLDESLLSSAARDLHERGPAELEVGGHSLRATFTPSATDRDVVAGVVRTPGWLCAAGEEKRTTPGVLAGLVSVPLPAGETEVSCTFRPRGLRMGLALGAASLVGVGGLAVLVARVRRWDLTP